MKMKRVRLAFWRLFGKKKIAYPKRDLLNNTIWVCTRCACHFIGERCPSRNHV